MNALRVYSFGLRVGWQEWKGFWSWRTWVGGWMVRMVAQALFIILLGELLNSPERLRYLLIGNVVAIGVVSSWAVPASTWDRYDGTYSLLVVSPSGVLMPIVGRTSIWLFNSAASSIMAFAILLAVFGLDVPWLGVALSLPLILLSAAGYYCMSLCLGSIVARVPRFRNMVNALGTTSLVAFCGVNVPIEFWPQPIEALANLVPLTHNLQAIRTLLDSGPLLEAFELVLISIVVMVVWLAVAVLTMDRMANAGRTDGSIEFS